MPTATPAVRAHKLVSTAAELRVLLSRRFPDAVPVPEDGARRSEPVPVGVTGLERAFPAGGLPRGRLTAWLPQGGAAAILRAACRATIADGERAAWIDAASVHIQRDPAKSFGGELGTIGPLR